MDFDGAVYYPNKERRSTGYSCLWQLDGRWILISPGLLSELKETYAYEHNIETDECTFTRKQPIKKKANTMNYTTAAFIINKDLRAILTSYENYNTDAEAQRKGVVHKTLDQTIKVGDYVVVPTSSRHNMTVVKVIGVDVELDLDSNIQVNWIIGKVDKAAYENILGQEKKTVDVIRAAEAQAKKDELKAKILKLNPEQIKALPLYKNGESVTE